MKKTNLNQSNTPNDTTAQKWQLLNHLLKGYRITVAEALIKLNLYALSQRCGELRLKHGIPIQSQFIILPNGKRIKEYWLEQNYINAHKETTV